MSIFMQMETTAGEVSDQRHNGWLDVYSLVFGTNRAVTSAPSARGGRKSANVTISDLTLTRFMDSATPSLFLQACCGRGQEITIALTKTGQGQGADTFMTYTLHHALISAYAVEAYAQDVNRPLEVMTVSFVDLTVRYIPFDEAGTALAPLCVGFNTATNCQH